MGEHGARASRALAADRACLLLSTPSSTPITRARPRRRPISSLGKSTLPRGPGSDWLRRLSVRRASRKDAAGVLGSRSPERRRSNLCINKMGAPTSIKQGGGRSGVGCRSTTQPGGPTGAEVGAERKVGESLPPFLPPSLPPPPARPCCSCKHVSLHVCFPFSRTVAITGCCLPKPCKAEASSRPRPPSPAPLCLYSAFYFFFSLLPLVRE